MTYDLKILDYPTYLHFQVTGLNTAVVVRAYLQEVLKICTERQCIAALIEENLQGPSLSMVEMFQIASSASSELGLVRKIAYVDINPIHSKPGLEFVETVASNRHSGIRMFATVDEARVWIEERGSSKGGPPNPG